MQAWRKVVTVDRRWWGMKVRREEEVVGMEGEDGEGEEEGHVDIVKWVQGGRSRSKQ